MTPIDQINERQIAVVFDLDNTITRSDTYVAFLLSVLHQEPKRVVRSLWLPYAVMAHNFGFKNNTWLKTTFLRTIVGGANRNQIDYWADRFITKILANDIYSSALTAIQQHKELGHHLVLASASLDFYVTKLGQRLGFDEIICTLSNWDDSDHLTGELNGNNCYGEEKLNRLKNYFGNDRNQWHIIGYSDHHSDEPMLEWVDQPIAVNPTSKLNQIAGSRNYDIKNW